jgi:enoyl-[acyl-carrier protein] reductase I
MERRLEALERRVRPLAAQVGSDFLIDCDVSDMAKLDAAFATLAEKWPRLDFVVHAIGFSDKNELRGKYVDTSLDNFLMSMNISAYSFTAVARRARDMMPNGGGLLTLSYYGAEKVVTHYNVMGVAKAALEASVRYLAADLGPEGIRVNAISAGPIRTLSAGGISGFRKLYGPFNEIAPLRRHMTIEDVGNTSLYLASDLSSAVTGEVIYVDGGFNILGVPTIE